MRKIFLLVISVIVFSSVNAQLQLGLKFSPQMSIGRTLLTDDVRDFEPDDPGFKFALGLMADFGFAENYFFSTGLTFMPKRVAFLISNEDGSALPAGVNAFEDYNVQYLQVPITLKLYTNEFQPDMKIFFQVGAAPEVKIYDQPTAEKYNLVDQFQFFDVAAVLGVGTEIKVGLNTALVGGFSYQRGLVNQLRTLNNNGINFQEDPSYRNTIVSLDLGIKF
ncbi:MAG: outer membrane beta-barrel protein [Bacteroidota bacterium]